MLENKRIQKPRQFWISTAYFRASTVSFFKNVLLGMNSGLLKIRSVHTYVLKGFILVVSIVYSFPNNTFTVRLRRGLTPRSVDSKSEYATF
jgi:hypothetical protein